MENLVLYFLGNGIRLGSTWDFLSGHCLMVSSVRYTCSSSSSQSILHCDDDTEASVLSSEPSLVKYLSYKIFSFTTYSSMDPQSINSGLDTRRGWGAYKRSSVLAIAILCMDRVCTPSNLSITVLFANVERSIFSNC